MANGALVTEGSGASGAGIARRLAKLGHGRVWAHRADVPWAREVREEMTRQDGVRRFLFNGHLANARAPTAWATRSFKP